MNAIYLASGSPRRREILENLGFTVRRLPADTVWPARKIR